jgi:alanine-synthesizing transaminase
VTTARIHDAIPTAARVHRFTYAIRNIVAEALKVEATGKKVHYLNIGDPVAFGFKTPPHLLQAVEKAMHDDHNTYGPSAGIPEAREAVAREYARNGFPIGADRVFITAGTSEGIELTLGATINVGDEVLIPMPTYPLYTAVMAKLDAKTKFYRLDPSNGWMPDLDHLNSLVTPATKAIVVIDPNNPTGAVYPPDVRRALVDLAEEHGIPLLADEVYADLAFEGPVGAIAAHNPDAPVITFSSLSKAYLAPGWRAGWMGIGRTERLDDVLAAVKKLADGRLCATGPMEYAITAALNGDRSHQHAFRAALRARAELTTTRLQAIEGITVVPPAAAFYVMPKVALPPGVTDEDYVLGLLRATGVLCVYGSGFGTRPADGFFRIVFLASPGELASIYDDIGRFTAEFLSDRGA